MEKIAVMIGLGQLGRVFAGGLLRTGHMVVPVNRGDDPKIVAGQVPPETSSPRKDSIGWGCS